MHKAHPLIWAHSTSTNYSRFVYLETWFNFSKEFSADLLLVNFDLLWTNLNRTNSSLLDMLITKIKPSVTVLNVNFSFYPDLTVTIDCCHSVGVLIILKDRNCRYMVSFSVPSEQAKSTKSWKTWRESKSFSNRKFKQRYQVSIDSLFW